MRSIPIIAIVAMLIGCGNNPAAPIPPAQVIVRGELIFDCGADACQFSGTVANFGPGCATQVHGQTNISGIQREWRLPDTTTLSPSETATFSGALSKALMLTAVPIRSQTTVQWTDARCS